MVNFFLFLLGICFGSFVSAFSYRYLRGISVARGRSFCPKCKSKINWFDNIPILSFFLLKGKCRNCKKKISSRYPIIELASGTGFVLIGIYTIPDYIYTLYLLAIFVLLLLIFVIDLENQIIPDLLVFVGVFLVTVYSIFFTPQSIFSLLSSGFVAATFLMLINLLTRGRGMGLGDVKFAVLGGMLVGLKLLPIWLLMAFLTGATVGSILILVGKAKMKTKIAFGPFLIASIVLAVTFGNSIVSLLGLI